MRPHVILAEAWRNVASGTTRAGLLFLLALVLGTGLVVADLVETLALLDEASAYRDGGAATLTLVAPDRVSGAACDALTGVPGVEAAGALRESEPALAVAALPDAPVPLFETTPGLPGVLGAAAGSGRGLVLSGEVADAVGGAASETLFLAGGTAPIDGTFAYPLDGRRPELGWSALSPSANGQVFDECWVRAWPESTALRSLLMQTLLPGASDAAPTLSQLNPTLGSHFTGGERFAHGILRFAPLVALAASALLGAAAIRTRRLEIAANLHARARRRDVLIQIGVETAAWATPAAASAGATALVLAAMTAPENTPAVAVQGGWTAAALLLGCAVGALAAGTGVRERHLFRYAKDRG